MEMKRNGFRFPYSGYTIRGTIWIQSFCLGLNEVVGVSQNEKRSCYIEHACTWVLMRLLTGRLQPTW